LWRVVVEVIEFRGDQIESLVNMALEETARVNQIRADLQIALREKNTQEIIRLARMWADPDYVESREPVKLRKAS
jgi:hypothetical protein